MIISFYSYKGGVGRTQLCANIASYLSIYKGKKVLLWDWDFEAPGLHIYFEKTNEDILSKGTIDLLCEYVKMMRSTIDVKQTDLPRISPDYFSTMIESTPEGGKVDLLPAGNYSEKFARLVYNFGWNEFYELLDGAIYIEVLKKQLIEFNYDYVLIDSRTGISDYSGICNIQLPEANVVVVAPNEQNFKGCKNIIEQIINSDYIKKGFRKPFLMPILSKLDLNNKEYSNWIKRFSSDFSSILPIINPEIDSEFVNDIFEDIYLNQTLLEYSPSISLGEPKLFNNADFPILKVSFERKIVNIATFIENLKDQGSLGIYQQIDKDTWTNYGLRAEKQNLNTKAIIAYEKSGNLDKAIELGGTYYSWFEKAKEFYLNDNIDKAIEYYKRAIDFKPDRQEAYFNLGLAYSKNNYVDNAIVCYEKVIKIKPDKHEAYFNLGLAYLKKGDFQKSIEFFLKSIEIKPDKYKAYFNLGVVYSKIEDLDAAINFYNKALEIEPNYHAAYLNLGKCYSDKSDNKKATECYEKAIEIKPDYNQAYVNLGFTLLKSGNLKLSEKHFLKSIKLGNNTYGNMNLGHIYLIKKNKQKAFETYCASITNFSDKDSFFKGYDNDYQHLIQYKITLEAYKEMREKLLKFATIGN